MTKFLGQIANMATVGKKVYVPLFGNIVVQAKWSLLHDFFLTHCTGSAINEIYVIFFSLKSLIIYTDF